MSSKFTLLALVFCALSAPVFAQQAAPAATPQKKQPVTIEADNQLEWLRDKNMYRGSGNVTVTQGDTVIKGDTAEAYYDPAVGPSAMTTMVMTGNVVITNQDRVIHAGHGTYDTRTQVLILDGGVLTLTTPTMTVTAHKTMEYYGAENKAIARGNADVTQPGQKLKADVITAWIDKATNKLDHAEAVGNVLINHNTPQGQDIAQADKGLYSAAKNTADLYGNVRLTRGTNHMQGDHATIDLTTGYSTLQNAPGGSGRVRAVFTPGDSSAPLPGVTTPADAMIPVKKKFEEPYALGVKEHAQ